MKPALSLLALACAMAATAPALAAGGTPEARAAATEAAMTDAERTVLTIGVMPLPFFPGVKVPEGAGPIVYEDPRLGLMMAAPPRNAKAPRDMQPHVSETPHARTLLLWESWLRHEVPLNRAAGERISISFNYVIG